MVRKILFISLITVLIVTSLVSACTSTKTTTSSSTAASTASTQTSTISKTTTFDITTVTTSSVSETTTKSSTGDWWESFGTPQYGDTLSLRLLTLDSVSFDPQAMGVTSLATYYLEGLFGMDWWSVDRNTWGFQTGFNPLEYYNGRLAESWEQTDPLTITVKIREGVLWQDKYPVNGREFTANDVQFTFDRLLGTGSGFTTPNMFAMMSVPNIAKVEAIDDYTVQYTLKQSSVMSIYQVLDGSTNMLCQEFIDLNNAESAGSNPMQDWHNAVGTGPYMLSDFLSGTSALFVRNPTYWGYDERYPENQLPYIDNLKVIAIPDIATAIAAFRTQKSDVLGGGNSGLTWQLASSITKDLPDVMQAVLPNTGVDIDLRCDTEPFTDIKVRKALQMAIDRTAIAQTHYGGLVDGNPCGIISPLYSEFAYTYDKWSDELKTNYSYNLTEARKLLSEAGYPNGFTTDVVCRSADDITLLQIIKAQFMEISVDMEIRPMDTANYISYVSSGKHDQMAANIWTGVLQTPSNSVSCRLSTQQRNYTKNNDSYYDDLINNKLNAATTMSEVKAICVEADKYSLEQNWAINVCPTPNPIVWWSYIKSYSGEQGGEYKYWWIDEDLKASTNK